jgi:hypothetical protein
MRVTTMGALTNYGCRWAWWVEGLSRATQHKIFSMSEAEWIAFEPRLTRMIFKRHIRGLESTFHPLLADWEQEVFLSILALASETCEKAPLVA